MLGASEEGAALARTLGEVVRGLRERNGWTMGQLAAKAGVDTSYISKLEADKIKRPGAETLVALAAALRIKPSVLIDHLHGRGADELPPASTTVDVGDQRLAGYFHLLEGLSDSERESLEHWLLAVIARRERGSRQHETVGCA